jgi:hypothetical protein
MIHKNGVFSGLVFVLALSLLTGCKIDIAGLFPPDDPPEYCFDGSVLYSWYFLGTPSGTFEADASSTLRMVPRQTYVSSGDCSHPLITVVLAEFDGSTPIRVDGATLQQVRISFAPKIRLNQEFVTNYLAESSPVQLEIISASKDPGVCGRSYENAYYKQARVTVEKVPQNIAEGGEVKLSFRLVIDAGIELSGHFTGGVPVPRTQFYTESDPVQCTREYNAVENYQAQLELAGHCQQSSDCVVSDLNNPKSCNPFAVNKDATNLDPLRAAVEEYESVFRPPYECSLYGDVILPSCDRGHCNAHRYSRID